jgi:hypothetical protein
MHIDEFLQKQEDLRNELSTQGRNFVEEFFSAFFLDFPELTAVRWRQYTPGYNDGSPCIFTVCEPVVSFTPFSSQTELNDALEEDLYGGINWYSLSDLNPKYASPEQKDPSILIPPDLYIRLACWDGKFNRMAPVFEQLGDVDSEVMVSRGDHINVTIVEYTNHE